MQIPAPAFETPSLLAAAAGRPRRRGAWGAALAAFWLFFGLLNASQLYFGLRMESFPAVLWRLLGVQVLGWLFWIPATPCVLWLGRRFPIVRAGWWRVAPVHFAAAIVLALGHTAVFQLLANAFLPFGPPRQPQSFWSQFVGRAMSQFHLELLVYAGILGTGYALSYYARYRERELRASQLESQLTRARLHALEMQLHPHFLFNTLNGIAALVRDQRNTAAVDMLAGLSDLLRYTLENAGKQAVTLEEELGFLELYLGLQQMRFPDRLRVEYHIDPAARAALVPNLVLQPLVENAIRHGVSRQGAGGTVAIHAACNGDSLCLKVADDGPGPGAPGTFTDGVGLSNTRARLVQLYGDRQHFELVARPGGGAEATLRIPLEHAHHGSAA